MAQRSSKQPDNIPPKKGDAAGCNMGQPAVSKLWGPGPACAFCRATSIRGRSAAFIFCLATSGQRCLEEKMAQGSKENVIPDHAAFACDLSWRRWSGLAVCNVRSADLPARKSWPPASGSSRAVSGGKWRLAILPERNGTQRKAMSRYQLHLLIHSTS